MGTSLPSCQRRVPVPHQPELQGGSVRPVSPGCPSIPKLRGVQRLWGHQRRPHGPHYPQVQVRWLPGDVAFLHFLHCKLFLVDIQEHEWVWYNWAPTSSWLISHESLVFLCCWQLLVGDPYPATMSTNFMRFDFTGARRTRGDRNTQSTSRLFPWRYTPTHRHTHTTNTLTHTHTLLLGGYNKNHVFDSTPCGGKRSGPFVLGAHGFGTQTVGEGLALQCMELRWRQWNVSAD